MRRTSLSGRIAALVVGNVIIAALLTLASVRIFDRLGGGQITAIITALAIAVPIAIWSARSRSEKYLRMLTAIAYGVRGLRDRDFSLRLVAKSDDQTSALARLSNDMAAVRRSRRTEL